MDFSLNEEQLALQHSARQFATRELVQPAREIEDNDQPPSHALVKRFAELGYLGINLDPALGGGGASHVEAVLVLEEIAKISPSVAFPIFESCFGPVLTIQHFASDALKQRLVPKVCSGDMIIAASMSEPDAGTALTDLKTRAVRQGDTLVLNGQKRWCSGAGHADGYVVYCRLSDEPGARGIGAVYVDKDTPGLSFGKRERLMGFRGVASADIFLDNVTVPVGNIVAPAGGFSKLMTAFDLERCGNATMSLALAQSALDQALAYVQDRRQFGKAIVDFQAVQIKLADMAIRVDAARLLIHRAVANASDGLPSSREASMAKCFANEMVRGVCGDAMQLMGGYGYACEYGMERRMRDAWGWGIAGGAIDIQKINIASALVGRRFNQRG
ncbi:MAG: acyl-CoA dehydrogenase family protein [Rhizobiales bacterium]|nr:acyl-CoA dehydrogenase family protein [Hyphomicrobiales bacterium]